MADPTNRPKARLPRGFADRTAADIRTVDAMLARIRAVYERYGFEPVETPLIEYTDALGKFLPDLDRPNEGVFSFKDDDESWLSLRYDLTAPLARYVAENFERLPKPYRSYRAGWVFRNEKPGPGRFRQFMQFDADTVGAASPAADAEMCMMMADAIEAVGLKRGQYAIKVNSRRVLDGVMELAGLSGDENSSRRLTVLRAIDKFDRLGVEGVRLLLGEGRKDESGDFTKGAGLAGDQIGTIFRFVNARAFVDGAQMVAESRAAPNGDATHKGMDIVGFLDMVFGRNETAAKGIAELRTIADLVRAAGYADRVEIDPSVVRGLEYYTGAVFEAQLLFDVPNERGENVVFGSVGGGGRYDGLVGRFRGEDVPATGFSIGVSRLASALKALAPPADAQATGPVVVLVMDQPGLVEAQRMVGDLRRAGVTAEMYLGSAGMKAQMKYADRRNAPCVVIQGSDERVRGVVQLKDLALGKELAGSVGDHAAYAAARPGQFEVAAADVVAEVKALLERQAAGVS
ncbi:MAG: histidine--tRNA ligase [Bauldia sp.]|nr:histidine--tRNA ligase [Bauldia sp.]